MVLILIAIAVLVLLVLADAREIRHDRSATPPRSFDSGPVAAHRQLERH